MEKDKRSIGDNSKNRVEDNFTSIFEKEAVSEMMTDIKACANEAEQLIYKLSDALKKLTTGKDSLTCKQENWNSGVDEYNEWVIDQNPNPAYNKKRLRTKYKPAKLAGDEIAEIKKSMSDDLDIMIEKVTDVSATVNTYQDKDSPVGFRTWVDAARDGAKSDE